MTFRIKACIFLLAGSFNAFFVPSLKAENALCAEAFSVLGVETDRIEIGFNVVKGMRSLIENSQKSIWIEWRDFPPQDIVDLLIQKKKLGLDVRVILDGRDFKKSAELVAQYKKTLENFDAAGIKYVVSNIDELSLFREYPRSALHRKIIIADGSRSYVGSANIGKYQDNFEIGLFRGKDGNEDLANLFNLDWKSIEDGWKGPVTTVQETTFFRSSDSRVKLFGLGTGSPNYKNEVMQAIESTKSRLWISAFEASDKDVLKAILRKKKDNPDMDLKVVLCDGPMSLWFKGKDGKVTNSNISKNSNFFRTLLDAGVEVRKFSQPGTFNHSRFLVTDQEILGMSGDLTERSFEHNVELGFRSSSPAYVADGKAGFERLWDASLPADRRTKMAVLKEKFFEWYQDYLSFLIKRRKTKNSIETPSSNIVTYGIEIEYYLDSKILDYYRLNSISEQEWVGFSAPEKKERFLRFLRECKGIAKSLFSPECKLGLAKLKNSPDWMPEVASYELHGTIELSGFVFENLDEVKKFTNTADEAIGVGYYQGHVVWPKRLVPGLFGYMAFQYDKSAIKALTKGYEKWEKTGEIPAKSFARRALGYPDKVTAQRIQNKVEMISPKNEIGKGGLDRLISGPVIRDDVYPEGWIGIEHRQFHRNPGAMIDEMKLNSIALTEKGFERYRQFEGFQGVSLGDVNAAPLYTDSITPSSLKRFLQKLDLKMRYDHGLVRAGSSSFSSRFLLPLKFWEHHPLVLSGTADEIAAKQQKIHFATKNYLESLSQAAEGDLDEAENKVRIAISKWAYESGLDGIFDSFNRSGK